MIIGFDDNNLSLMVIKWSLVVFADIAANPNHSRIILTLLNWLQTPNPS